MLGSSDGIRVLVADDDKLIADTLSQILAMNGYFVKSVSSGEEAIEVASKWCPDVLISDVIMTGINGIEAASRILGVDPKCKVILFSGQASTMDLAGHAAQRGRRFEILAKPVHPQIFLDHLSNLKKERGQTGPLILRTACAGVEN